MKRRAEKQPSKYQAKLEQRSALAAALNRARKDAPQWRPQGRGRR